jgi:major vault protein
MKSLKTFTDAFGKNRLNGEEWFIKISDTESHLPDVYEEVVAL